MERLFTFPDFSFQHGGKSMVLDITQSFRFGSELYSVFYMLFLQQYLVDLRAISGDSKLNYPKPVSKDDQRRCRAIFILRLRMDVDLGDMSGKQPPFQSSGRQV
jgi:hypothetical protein